MGRGDVRRNADTGLAGGDVVGSLRGFEDVNARFKAAMRDIGVSRTQGVVTKIIIAIKRDAATMTPMDTGFLAGSAYSKTWRTASGWEGEVGYGAEYAAAVHQMSGKLKGQQRADFGSTSNHGAFGPMRPTSFGGGTGTGVYWGPDAEPQFLAKAVDNVIREDLQAIIASEYRI